MKKQEPKRRQSKLEKYKTEIHTLYQQGYKVEQIQDFLKKNKINVSLRYIWKFLNKSLNKKFFFKNPPAAPITKNETISQKTDAVSFQDIKKLVKKG